MLTYLLKLQCLHYILTSSTRISACVRVQRFRQRPLCRRKFKLSFGILYFSIYSNIVETAQFKNTWNRHWLQYKPECHVGKIFMRMCKCYCDVWRHISSEIPQALKWKGLLYEQPSTLNDAWVWAGGCKQRYPKGESITCYQECGCHLKTRKDEW